MKHTYYFFISITIVLVILAVVFYFFQRPSALNLAKSVNLATPVPSPTPTLSVSLTLTAVSAATPIPQLTIHTIGQITHHAQNFVNQTLKMQGYLLAIRDGYDIFSDESGGAINPFDLPIRGLGIATVTFKKKYQLYGKFLFGGLTASNNNQYHLELLAPPQLVK